jgi:hypothetical protein
LQPAGSTSLGLDAPRRSLLLATLEDHEVTPRRRRSVRWAAPAIEVVADLHGRPDGPVCDAVLRAILLPDRWRMPSDG